MFQSYSCNLTVDRRFPRKPRTPLRTREETPLTVTDEAFSGPLMDQVPGERRQVGTI